MPDTPPPPKSSSAPEPGAPRQPAAARPQTASPALSRVTAGALLGWLLAAALALAVLWLASRRAAGRAALSASRIEAEFAALEIRDLRQQLEAERILSAAQLARLRAAAFPADTQLHAFRALDNTGRLSLHLVACAAWSPSLGRGELHFASERPPAGQGRKFVLTLDAAPDTPGPRLAEFSAGAKKLAFTTPPGTDANARFFIHELAGGGLAPVAASRPAAKPETQ
ncbi:MAG: hypothetical protein LBM92_07600 [Opitutaceae bacterium]|jgi:hypothetical protein|nr:hypothetical protein [Opitutaceae bacterium]